MEVLARASDNKQKEIYAIVCSAPVMKKVMRQTDTTEPVTITIIITDIVMLVITVNGSISVG